MAALIAFPAADIPIEGVAVELELPPRWLEATLSDAGVEAGPCREAGAFTGRLSRSGQDIVVRGQARARLALPCVRCLEPAFVDVAADLSLLLLPVSRSETRNAKRRGSSRGAVATPAEYEFSADEAAQDVYDGETVVLDAFIREAILLEIPAFPLCTESCPGIATEESPPGLTSVDGDEIDPRLAPLGAFREDPSGPTTLDQLVAASRARSAALGRKPVLRANRRGRPSGKRNKK